MTRKADDEKIHLQEKMILYAQREFNMTMKQHLLQNSDSFATKFNAQKDGW